jgi:hypothetical protein
LDFSIWKKKNMKTFWDVTEEEEDEAFLVM